MRPMTFQEFKKKRHYRQQCTWFVLPFILVAGWFFPVLGYIVPAGAAAALLIAPYKGRYWCDWLCPMGSFYDLYLNKISKKGTVPSFFRKRLFKIATGLIVLGAASLLVYGMWGTVNRTGLALLTMLAASVLLGVALGIRYHARGWCSLCPVGTLANACSLNRHHLRIDISCRSCGVCELVCSMQLNPAQYRRDGEMRDDDCIHCMCCAFVCPQKAIAPRKQRS